MAIVKIFLMFKANVKLEGKVQLQKLIAYGSYILIYNVSVLV